MEKMENNIENTQQPKFEPKIDTSRYSFVESINETGDKITGIRLEDLEYKNLIYEYIGNVTVGNNDENNQIPLNYNINIFTLGEAPEGTPDTQEFKSLVGDILVDLICKKMHEDPGSIQFVSQDTLEKDEPLVVLA